MQIKYLDGKRFYRGLLAGGKAVIRDQNYLNKINVFPVADADTGVNLALTMQAIMERSRIAKSLKETLRSVADSALSGARGNSGIIFAQYLYGLSRELPERGTLEIAHFAESARRAVRYMYDSLMEPREGTMLTVIREWSEALLEHSRKSADFLQALTDSLADAKRSLSLTPTKLKVLADAGVVDAGASGFVSFLEGIVDFLHRGSLKGNTLSERIGEIPELAPSHPDAPDKYRYCTEAIFRGFSCSTNLIKGIAGGFGDSLILAGDQEKLHLHIHTNEPEKLFEELFRLGEVSGAKVEDMLRQYQISHARKFPIGLITDSACDLPQEIMDYYQIVRIPFGINFGTRAYLDKLTITGEMFYDLLRSDPIHPVSNQPSPTTLRAALETSLANYPHLIAVHISDKLTGVYQTMLAQAAGLPKKRLGIVNTRQLSVSEGLVTLRVAKAIEAGMSFEEIMRNVNDWATKTRIYTDVNTLKYMVRGGRVKPLTGMIASLLNLKPIVSLDAEGKALPIGKSFTRSANMRRIIDLIRTDLAHNKLVDYAIVHADAPDRAIKYGELLEQLTGKKPAYIMPLSPVVGVHNGIGAIGIGLSYD